MDTFSPAVQRPALDAFAAALGSADNALKLDECRDWHIAGKFGHVLAYAPGRYQFFVSAGAKQAWTYAKKALAFAKLTQDGDEEGGFLLDRLPTKAEATAIRDYCGVHKRPAVSPERLAEQVERGRVLQKIRLAA